MYYYSTASGGLGAVLIAGVRHFRKMDMKEKIRVSINASKKENEASVPVADMRLFPLLGVRRYKQVDKGEGT